MNKDWTGNSKTTFVQYRTKYQSSAVCYAWFIWEKGFKGETIVRWI